MKKQPARKPYKTMQYQWAMRIRLRHSLFKDGNNGRMQEKMTKVQAL